MPKEDLACITFEMDARRLPIAVLGKSSVVVSGVTIFSKVIAVSIEARFFSRQSLLIQVLIGLVENTIDGQYPWRAPGTGRKFLRR